MLPLKDLLVVSIEQAVAAPVLTVRLADAGARLIAVDIVGYGPDTAYRDMRAYDMLIQAESGICAVTGTADRPVKVGVSMADVGAGMSAHAAVLEALIERSMTGRGQAIEMAMFDAMADLMSVPLLHHEYAGRETPRAGLSRAAIYLYGRVACSDGEIVVVVENLAEWRRFCVGVLRRPDLVEDDRFASNPSRVVNREALSDIMAEVFGALARRNVIARLEANSLPWSNVSPVAELSLHPALRRMAVDTPGGVMQGVASAVRREVKSGAVPSLGQHTDAIRREFGG